MFIACMSILGMVYYCVNQIASHYSIFVFSKFFHHTSSNHRHRFVMMSPDFSWSDIPAAITAGVGPSSTASSAAQSNRLEIPTSARPRGLAFCQVGWCGAMGFSVQDTSDIEKQLTLEDSWSIFLGVAPFGGNNKAVSQKRTPHRKDQVRQFPA